MHMQFEPEEDDFALAQILVESILANIDSEDEMVYSGITLLADDDSEVELMVHREDFSNMLTEFLELFEAEEEYEKCAEIKRAISRLTAANPEQ